jgi:hypothetical protein
VDRIVERRALLDAAARLVADYAGPAEEAPDER